MEAAGGEGCGDPIWLATTNWIEAGGGSLGDAISFNTSAAIDDEEQEAKPVLLLRPDGDDPPPCEITIRFRKKHEIYQVYVRSTARIYEIYFSCNHQDTSKEYLCTVRCGAAIKEMVPDSVTVGPTSGFLGNISNGTAYLPDKVVRGDSNSSDEDGWVQVKAPDLLLQHGKEYSVSEKCDGGIDDPKLQIHYEATAEISDSSPCVSLTLRLLSIQTQACVHVEEIYVYADPVESSDSDPPVSVGENMGGSALLAMLVPSLLHLSKSDTSQNKCRSMDATVSTHQVGMEITTRAASSDMGSTVYSWKTADQKLETEQERTSVKSEEVRSESIQKVTSPKQMTNSLADQSNSQAYNRIEKVLDELVLKVGRIENLCSKFEENMLKPLSCIGERLQQLEEKVDALAVKSESSEQCPCSRISSLESNKYELKNKDANTKDTESREDSRFMATASPADEVEPFVTESQTRPGLVIKAPEFLNEDDDSSNTEDTVDPLVEDMPEDKKALSVDSALASSLAAFLNSTIEPLDPMVPTPSLTAIAQESADGNNSMLDSLVVVPSEVADCLSDSIGVDDCDYLAATRKGTSFGESSLLSHDAAIVNDELLLDMKKDYGMTDEVAGKTTSDDSSSVSDTGLLSSMFPSLTGSSFSFILMAPEFLNKDSPLICDGNLDSPDLDCLENQASLSTVRQAVPPLEEFLSLRTLSSPESPPASFRAPSALARTDISKLSASTGAVCEGADASGIRNQEENEMEDEVNSDCLLCMSPLKSSFEQDNCVGMGLNKHLSIEKTGGHIAKNLHDCTLPDSNAGFSLNCHDKSKSDIDGTEKASLSTVRQAVLPSEEFLSLRTLSSPESPPAPFRAPSTLARTDNSKLSASTGAVCEGADASGIRNQEENEIEDEVNSDCLLCMSPLKSSSEQDDCVGMRLNKLLAIEKTGGHIAQNLHDCTFPDSNAGFSLNCHDGSKSDTDGTEKASLSTVRQAVLPSEEFLSLRTLSSPESPPAPFRAPSTLARTDNSKLSASTGAVCEGADASGIRNQEENEMEDEVNSDCLLCMSPLKSSSEQDDCVGMRLNKHLSIEKTGGYIAQNLHDCTLPDSNAGFSLNCYDGSKSDIDGTEKASLSTVRQAILPSEEFLSLRTLSSPESPPAPFRAPSTLARTDNSKLSASTGAVCEGADASGIRNQEENEMEDEVNSDCLLCMSPLKSSSEQDFVGMRLNKHLSIEKTGGYIAQNLHDCTLPDSNAGFSLNCHDGSKSDIDGTEKASLSTVRQAVLPSEEFLSLRTLSSPESPPAPFRAPSALARTDNSKLSASTGAVCEGADDSGIRNQEENEMEDEVNSDCLLCMSPLKSSFEQDDCVGMGLNKHLSIEKTGGHIAQNLHDCTLPDSNAGFSLNCHDGSKSDTLGTEKASLHGFDQHGSEWIKGRSTTSPSIHDGNSIKERIETELSVGGSSDSSTQILPITHHSNWRIAAGNYERDPKFALEKIISHAESSAYYSWERSDKELEDVISDVKFTSDRNLEGLPLELLLGVMPDPETCVTSASGVEGDEAATGVLQLHNPSSSEGIIDLESHADGSLLPELPPEPYVDLLIGK